MSTVTITVRIPDFQFRRFWQLGFRYLFWIAKRLLKAVILASTLIGAFCVTLAFSSSLSPFFGTAIFRQRFAADLKIAFLVIVAMYLSFSMIRALYRTFDSFWKRTEKRNPALAKKIRDIFWEIVTLIFLFFFIFAMLDAINSQAQEQSKIQPQYSPAQPIP